MRVLVALLLGLAPSLAVGQTITTSPRPDAVAVTVYRDPNRSSAQPLNLSWLNGYALISETRRVSLPAGESQLRFEGVAGGIIPQSAIVAGLPHGIVERNRDAYLLSPGTLLDRSLGKRVYLRRTNAAGKVTEQDAVIRSGADGAVVLQTAAGIEALRCSGEGGTLVYDEVPAGLSAKPTLSVRVRSTQPIAASVTLSYLATGFDWQANYVARLSPAGDRVDLFAWLTLANGDETGFADAQAQAVAGKPNREAVEVQEPVSRPISLRCWPQGTTTDGLFVEQYAAPGVPPPPPPPSPERGGGEQIIVTGARVAMKARQENLGDLKLYAIPERVTVAANSQKQVAMIVQDGVKVAITFRQRIDPGNDGFDQPAMRTLVTRNRTVEGLGLPLPAGGVALFASYGGRPVLLGEGSVDDLAVGEDVEIEFGTAAGVRGRLIEVSQGRYELTVTNDGPSVILYEAEFAVEGQRLKPNTRLGKRDGRPLWTVTVPANGTRTLRYRYDPEA